MAKNPPQAKLPPFQNLPTIKASADHPCSKTIPTRAIDPPTTSLAVTIAGVNQQLHTIARLNHTTEKSLLKLNPGLTPENVTPGDALLFVQTISPTSRTLAKSPQSATSNTTESKMELARGIRGRKYIALTFDCGWVEKKDLDRLLPLLKDQHVAASFFLTGIFLDEIPNGARRIAKAGFPIYNHSMKHPHFTKISDKEVQEQLLGVERKVHTSSTLTTHPYWRAPYGDRDARVLRLTSAIGYQSVYWTLDSLDSKSKPMLTSQQIAKRVLSRKSSKDADPLDGAIILFHTAAKATPDALNEIIPALRKRGYEFVDIPTLFSPCASKPMAKPSRP